MGGNHLLHDKHVLPHFDKVRRSFCDDQDGHTEGENPDPFVEIVGVFAEKSEHRKTHDSQIESGGYMKKKVSFDGQDELVEGDLV